MYVSIRQVKEREELVYSNEEMIGSLVSGLFLVVLGIDSMNANVNRTRVGCWNRAHGLWASSVYQEFVSASLAEQEEMHLTPTVDSIRLSSMALCTRCSTETTRRLLL